MTRTRPRKAPSRRRWWLWAGLGVAASVIAGSVLWSVPSASGGTPRLVLDREVVELGDLAFGTPARAVFTLSNAGTGPLRITEAPQVTAAEGC